MARAVETVEFQNQSSVTLFQRARDGNWDDAMGDIADNANFAEIKIANQNDGMRTLLHYACETNYEEHATLAVKTIFKKLDRLVIYSDEMESFLNSRDENKQTPLQIAVKRGFTEVIDILLSRGADIWIEFKSGGQVNENYHKTLLRVFDQGLNIQRDLYDESNESLWILSCDFSAITGEPIQYSIKASPPNGQAIIDAGLEAINVKLEAIAMKLEDMTSQSPLLNTATAAPAPNAAAPVRNAEALAQLATAPNAAASPQNGTLSSCAPQHALPAVPNVEAQDPNVPTAVRNGEAPNASNDSIVSTPLPETRSFSQILRLPWQYCQEMCLHPLVQLYVLDRVDKHQILLWLSIFCNIARSSLFGIFILGAPTNIMAPNVTVNNHTVTESGPVDNNTASSRLTYNVTIFPCNVVSHVYHDYSLDVVRWILVGSLLLEEIIKLILCSSKLFHLKQLKTICNWMIILVVFFGGIKRLCAFMNTAGLLASLILIPVQLVEFQSLGIYMLILIKGVKKLMLLTTFCSPFLFALGFVFSVLWPNEKSFAWQLGLTKIIAVFITGELNFDALFSTEDHFTSPAITFITIFLFIQVMFLTVLLAYAVKNFQKMQKEATGDQIAILLEIINIYEELFFFLMKFWSCIKRLWCAHTNQPNNIDDRQENLEAPVQEPFCIVQGVSGAYEWISNSVVKRLWNWMVVPIITYFGNVPISPNILPQGIRTSFGFHRYFERIPHQIKKDIYGNTYLFPNGYNGRGDLDV